ncbi:MAG: 2-amino-4-hydroxy-6-hydroxymethyldihydropteridine diphosphokinase [Magnetococcales bacterium]|nr:2-amino-4-hydroxy-6-hydroxymethyldihydropteridine diphosphokinase [Magnetococcales bacterium]
MDEPLLIAFGSNLDPLPNLTAGLTRLHACLGIRRISRVYRTAPVGEIASQPDFLNGVVALERGLPPLELKALLRDIEAAQKRERPPGGKHYGPRTLDLDILLMGARVVKREGLTIPDPDLLTRPFLAWPAAELYPLFPHPLTGLSLVEGARCLQQQPGVMEVDPEASRLLTELFPALE